MKPIQLTWSGLQSYREKQEIDFTLLCDAGVFGIFGPTGSGKSTILDAITLALYGKVERASNGTQGILNQAENILTVSFTFELSHAEGLKKYRVERQFKRAADVSVTNTICRLIQIHSNHEAVVIADKAGEVNAQILQILGLSMQDFSRAVILPQGKFAEFLSLKGTDRRQMLQRLFHLEHYGDVLNARVSQRTKETDVAIKQIVAEQLGLGDASAQALQLSKLQLEEACQSAKQKRLALQQAMQQWEDMKRLRSLQHEKEELEVQQNNLILHEPRITQQEQRLKAADQAERVRHFLLEFEETQLQAQTLVQQQELMTKQHAEVSTQTEKVVQQHVHAKNELTVHDAPLQVKLEQLKQAVLLERDIQRGRIQEDELIAKLGATRRQADLSRVELFEQQDIHARALKKQEKLQEQLKELEVKADHRLMLQNALRDKQALDATESKTIDLEQQTIAKQEQLVKEKCCESECSNQLTSSQSHLSTHLHAVKGIELMDSQIETGLENLKLKVLHAIEQVEQNEKTADITRHALHLAGQLQEQQPCPVCGSTEHPAPVTLLSEAQIIDPPAASELVRYELLLSYVHKLQLIQERQAMQRQALEQKLTEALPVYVNGKSAEIEAAAAISSASQPSQEWITINDLEYDYEQLSQQLKLTGQQLVQMQEETQITFQQKERITKQQMEASAQLQAIQSIYDNLKMQLLAAQNTFKLQLQQWQTNYPMLYLESIQIKSDQLNKQDRAAEQLRLRIEQSIPFIEDISKKVLKSIEENTVLDKQRIQLETELNGLQKQNIELQNQFKTRWEQEIKEGGSIAQHILETEHHLKLLRETELFTQQQMEQSQRELFQLNEQFISLSHAADSAQQAYTKAKQFWEEALQRTSFITADEVRNALLAKQQIESWQLEVNQHREQGTRITAKLVELANKLNGQTVSERQWADIELLLTTARETDELALQERAKLERDLEQLQSKHLHWCELEQQLFKRKQEFTDLSKLQSVLRGNTFVEYIAEEQLSQVCRIASERLGQLTRQRYALEVDSSGGFVIRDDANGGMRRPVSTLSGGETFLTSLALALALSAQIQLSGQYPLEFFFLDEGFGTLDPELLETVVEALEKLHIDQLAVGIISHVPELKARLPRKLIVESAELGGRGSRVFIECM
ncbi:MAG: AAA family ATPase [Paenibacillaceae bacterium]